ncbi:hypothetical protein [Streptomyces montanus]|uniref:hypothetical protein n=1 Tax=Streptomyces montanus TaxID=2580423 RepID=UPI001486F1E1|nr:hypothetical protein [Streptomyces montanus]
MAVALVGVLAGSLLTNRAERVHWSRDKQIEACAAIVAESTRISPAVVAAAASMDEVFWGHSDQFIQQTATSEAA